MKYTLPGGYIINGKRYRDVYVKPITGQVEQDITEAYEIEQNSPEVTTDILNIAIDHIAGNKTDKELINSLCVVDRQFLMMKLSILLGNNSVWKHIQCNQCGEFYDIQVNKSDLPVIEANSKFPFASIDVRGKKLKLRVPNGNDQRGLTELNELDAVFYLLKKCVMSIDGDTPSNKFLQSLTQQEIDSIESVLESISPEYGLNLTTNCPECESEQIIYLNPYGIEKSTINNIYDDVHTIASSYHWSEVEILSMPRSRRKHYLDLIDSDYVEGY